MIDLNHIFTAIDWPNIIAGFILSLISAILVWFGRSAYEFYKASKDLPTSISGIWYSAEYDPKGDVPHEQRNTILKIKIRRRLNGGFYIRTISPDSQHANKISTGW